ncbi:MAG: hypothetical protein AB7G06_07015 [Bdellovibrionales bacterium]
MAGAAMQFLAFTGGAVVTGAALAPQDANAQVVTSGSTCSGIVNGVVVTLPCRPSGDLTGGTSDGGNITGWSLAGGIFTYWIAGEVRFQNADSERAAEYAGFTGTLRDFHLTQQMGEQIASQAIDPRASFQCLSDGVANNAGITVYLGRSNMPRYMGAAVGGALGVAEGAGDPTWTAVNGIAGLYWGFNAPDSFEKIAYLWNGNEYLQFDMVESQPGQLQELRPGQGTVVQTADGPLFFYVNQQQRNVSPTLQMVGTQEAFAAYRAAAGDVEVITRRGRNLSCDQLMDREVMRAADFSAVDGSIDRLGGAAQGRLVGVGDTDLRTFLWIFRFESYDEHVNRVVIRVPQVAAPAPAPLPIAIDQGPAQCRAYTHYRFNVLERLGTDGQIVTGDRATMITDFHAILYGYQNAADAEAGVNGTPLLETWNTEGNHRVLNGARVVGSGDDLQFERNADGDITGVSNFEEVFGTDCSPENLLVALNEAQDEYERLNPIRAAAPVPEPDLEDNTEEAAAAPADNAGAQVLNTADCGDEQAAAEAADHNDDDIVLRHVGDNGDVSFVDNDPDEWLNSGLADEMDAMIGALNAKAAELGCDYGLGGIRDGAFFCADAPQGAEAGDGQGNGGGNLPWWIPFLVGGAGGAWRGNGLARKRGYSFVPATLATLSGAALGAGLGAGAGLAAEGLLPLVDFATPFAPIPDGAVAPAAGAGVAGLVGYVLGTNGFLNAKPKDDEDEEEVNPPATVARATPQAPLDGSNPS